MRAHPYFDKYVRDHKMRPVKRIEHKHGSILLADSGEMIVEDQRMFFRTAYAILRDGEGLDFAQSAEYELNEPGGSQGEQKYRLAAAKLTAKWWLSQLIESGYYDRPEVRNHIVDGLLDDLDQ